MNRKDRKNFDYKKLKFTDYFQYESENEEEQTSEKEPSKKATKNDVNELNELIIKEETGIDSELFKNYLNFQMPTAMLKT